MPVIMLIRHGKTKGNLEQRYIGTTDEDLCEQGRAELQEKIAAGCYKCPDRLNESLAVQRVFASPMKRCIQTAQMIYPDFEPVIDTDFREMDFGEFENHNYQELDGNVKYQEWIDSNGTLPFPAGEDMKSFRQRVEKAFSNMINTCIQAEITCAACVVHGGVIMALMDAFAVPKKSYYDWQVKNGCGFAAEVEIEDGHFIIRINHRICT